MTRLALDAVAAFPAPIFATGSSESKDDSVADRDRCFGAWTESFEQFRERRARELERFETSQRTAIESLRTDVHDLAGRAELAGAPQRNRGFFG